MSETIAVYPRPDGKIGIRNLIAVISMTDRSSPIARRIAQGIGGAVELCMPHGGMGFAEDRERAHTALIGLGRNPNVAAALVLDMEEESAAPVAESIAAAGKPVEVIAVMASGGSVAAERLGRSWVGEQAARSAKLERQPAPLAQLRLGVQCGGSDTTSGLIANPVVGAASDLLVEAGGTVIMAETSEWVGAEHILAARAADAETAREIEGVVRALEEKVGARGYNIREANPGLPNFKGGITTLEEKSLGGISKGGTAPIRGVLSYGEAPGSEGAYLMDTPASGGESMTALAAGGAHLIAFTTGRGMPLGNPVAPTLKITGNPRTEVHNKDNIDFSAVPVLRGEETLAESGARLLRLIRAVAEGRLTQPELLGDVGITITPLGVQV